MPPTPICAGCNACRVWSTSLRASFETMPRRNSPTTIGRMPLSFLFSVQFGDPRKRIVVIQRAGLLRRRWRTGSAFRVPELIGPLRSHAPHAGQSTLPRGLLGLLRTGSFEQNKQKTKINLHITCRTKHFFHHDKWQSLIDGQGWYSFGIRTTFETSRIFEYSNGGMVFEKSLGVTAELSVRFFSGFFFGEEPSYFVTVCVFR